ncbi:MAG: tRNA lysidine(34) synthetase TilS [Gammaproteobacteria bacterium]|nr:tRNA lysidine(34) synthetase TilS [Rhodocyclaceae bacterium]MBU3907563.1 tRNA lysidine(34) synthetase TilS [Gammaproteobacteria bacterium]MBU3988662.1 tRNA lysidine(34) synthetase TilS [Gammaproteobacteria bacterium]MBU4004209.1 tRNA lysidine(34) synthetase TilS [Gammaproteobacteria bacterium]MBU4019617.1 tRNA lysidine(34) synthetase TilS [Gammaproteobacteria bacterium]
MASSKKLLSIESAGLSANALVKAVASSLARHVLPRQRVAVGLSGGMDSVSLLHALYALNTGREAFNLSAIHVHHGISPHADQWDVFCREYCERLRVPYVKVHVTVERLSKDGLEGAARRARHAAFADVDADWLMLAHQRDDQAETILFNLLRGSGVAGAAAMRERSGKLLRPMLSVGRDEVERYVRLHQLEWCEDESNTDTRYSRNLLRRDIIPALTQRFPATTKNLAAAAARFAEAHELLNELALVDLDGAAARFPLDLKQLNALAEPRARNLLRYLLTINQVQIPSEARLREALRQMLDAEADRHPSLVFGQHRLLRRRGWVYLEPVEACADKR